MFVSNQSPAISKNESNHDEMELLDKKNYTKLINLVRQVTINNLFARSVIEQKVTGQVFVDDQINPRTCYIIHPYGMSLLVGDCTNQAFIDWFKIHSLNIDAKRDKHEWMLAFPYDWDIVLEKLFDDRLIKSADNFSKREKGVIELNTRVNFKFNKATYLTLRKSITEPGIRIVKTDRQLFREIEGSVIPANFWDTEDDFIENGFGYSLLYNGKLAAMAFSSFWFDNQFEIGIETVEGFRGRGFAEIIASTLIDYCLENNYEPIWACRRENVSSYNLALKLGFEVISTIPYYRLSN